MSSQTPDSLRCQPGQPGQQHKSRFCRLYNNQVTLVRSRSCVHPNLMPFSSIGHVVTSRHVTSRWRQRGVKSKPHSDSVPLRRPNHPQVDVCHSLTQKVTDRPSDRRPTTPSQKPWTLRTEHETNVSQLAFVTCCYLFRLTRCLNFM